jgi:FAD/FMN-containing dehydrogenase
MDRREFLGLCGSTAALLALAGCDAATTTASTSPPRPTTTSSTGGHEAPTAAAWAALGRSLGGRVVVPSDPSYPTDKQLYNERFDDIEPAAIAYCSSPTDVQRCLEFARAHSVALAARSGGHSYGGYSSRQGGLVVDVTEMHDISVDTAAQSATVGAGTRLVSMYDTLGSSGVMVPGGSCPTVGIAGLALGGGIGVFGRLYGLTCDNVASLEIVTADSRVVSCRPDYNADLFWASRGGGGGNFGVVTSFTFYTHPVPEVTLFTLRWPFAAADDVLGSWLSWIGNTPDELWSNCQLLSSGAAGVSVKVTGVFAGPPATCSSVLQPLLRTVGSAPSSQFVGPESYLRAMLIEAGCEDESVSQCLSSPRAAFAAKSAFLRSPLPSSAVSSLASSVSALSSSSPGVGGGLVFDSYGGAVGRVPSDATAFVHRDALCGVEYSVSWGPAASASVTGPALSWLESVQSLLLPHASGAYQNYIDPTQPDWLHAYYGSNLPRLVSVKRSIDPDDVFRFAQSIPVSL